MPKIFEIDPFYVEAQYLAGDNALQLELMGAAPDALDAGGGSSASTGSAGGGETFLVNDGGGFIEGGGKRYDGFDSGREVPIFDQNETYFL